MSILGCVGFLCLKNPHCIEVGNKVSILIYARMVLAVQRGLRVGADLIYCLFILLLV